MTASERLWVGMPESHIAAFYEHLRLRRIERQRVRQVAVREWAAMPAPRRAIDDARDHLAAMPAERRALLDAEWVSQGGGR